MIKTTLATRSCRLRNTTQVGSAIENTRNFAVPQKLCGKLRITEKVIPTHSKI